MKGKIILEEHVCMPDQDLIPGLNRASRNGEDLFRALLDVHDDRLKEMNANGVEFAILSQSPAGPQGIADHKEAAAFATKSNDYISGLVAKAPQRFGAFACLAMHDPDAAAAELTRCVQELGMFGVMLHGSQTYKSADGTSCEFYYDGAHFDVFWTRVQDLGVPVYLHPKQPLAEDMARLYKGRPWMIGPTYSFARDIGFHTLALCTSGLFDRFPGIKLIIGHLGEMLLSHLERTDHWLEKRDRGRHLPAQKTLREYFDRNIHITTAGNFSTPTLVHAMTELGADRLLFSVDTPYENITEGASWFDTLPLSQADVVRMGRLNALSLFPSLERVLRSEETEKLQIERKRRLFTTNPGFEFPSA